MNDFLPGKRVLIVEDNPVLAYDVEDALRGNGVQVIGPALDLSSALKLARENTLDGAVLDIDLRGEFVWPLAYELLSNSVPFVFVSAECGTPLPSEFRDAACLCKPARSENILETVSRAMGKG